MEKNRFRGTVNNECGDPKNWSLGVVPTDKNKHIAILDKHSPNITINSQEGIYELRVYNNYKGVMTLKSELRVTGAMKTGYRTIWMKIIDILKFPFLWIIK